MQHRRRGISPKIPSCKSIPIGRAMVSLKFRCRTAGANFLQTASIVTIFFGKIAKYAAPQAGNF